LEHPKLLTQQLKGLVRHTTLVNVSNDWLACTVPDRLDLHGPFDVLDQHCHHQRTIDRDLFELALGDCRS
jgi:hypothetical protein